MSAMPAGWTEPSDSPRVGAMPVTTVTPAQSQRRAERRAAKKLERRSRRRWAIASCVTMAVALATTVGILDVLR